MISNDHYKRHLDAWIKAQAKIEINLAALSLVLEKFNYFNIKESHNVPLDDAIKQLYTSQEAKMSLKEAFSQITQCKHCPQVYARTSSRLLSSLLINLPGCTSLFIHRQSDKIMQICLETRGILDLYKRNHLSKFQALKFSKCGNRILNTAADPTKTNFDLDIGNVYQTIESEWERLNEFLSTLDMYPHCKPHLVASYQSFISSFKFHSCKFIN
ncbi:hypothetical protein BdWA1_003107 [Babesia duncani]|uniref:Uncharacterized protein n=1 Tax=Babesia duncani TaxID=323732 RepID=A0AAD9UN50_9APIC|nr:hypothetical protein BdWA1_003107 [Babesia duncani]